MLCWDRDERFLRELIGRLKRPEPGDKAFPWRSGPDRCKLYHEHDKWAECEWIAVNGLVRPPKHNDVILILDQRTRMPRWREIEIGCAKSTVCAVVMAILILMAWQAHGDEQSGGTVF